MVFSEIGFPRKHTHEVVLYESRVYIRLTSSSPFITCERQMGDHPVAASELESYGHSRFLKVLFSCVSERCLCFI